MEHKELWSLLGHAMRFIFFGVPSIFHQRIEERFQHRNFGASTRRRHVNTISLRQALNVGFYADACCTSLTLLCAAGVFIAAARASVWASLHRIGPVHHHGRASLSRGCLTVDLLKSSGRNNLLKLRLSSRLLHFYYSNALRVDADDIQQTSARLRFKCALLPWSVSEDEKKKRKSEEIETIEASAISCFFRAQFLSECGRVKEKYSE